MKGHAKAAAIGAGVSSFFYLCMTTGLRLGFAAADWRARRRDAATERTV